MDKKTLGFTLVAAVVVTAVGVTINQSNQGTVDLDSPLILPGLGADAATLNRVSIESAGNNLVVEGVMKDGKWVIGNLGDYSANTEKLSAVIEALKSARKVEAKTSKPEAFHHLGLRDLSDPQSIAALVTLTGSSGKHQILVGDKGKSGNGQYVRLVDDNQTWLIDKQIEKPGKAEDWIVRSMFDFGFDDIQSLKISGRYDYSLLKETQESKNFVVSPMPDNHEMKYASVADTPVRILGNMTFNALLPLDQWQDSWNASASKVTISLFDNKQTTMTLVRAGEEEHYVRVEGDNPLWQDWAYQISPHAHAQLVKDQMEFLDVKEAPATP